MYLIKWTEHKSFTVMINSNSVLDLSTVEFINIIINLQYVSNQE